MDQSEPNHFSFLSKQIPPIHKAGWVFIVPLAIATLVVRRFSKTISNILGILTIWCAYFYRDPERIIPSENFVVVAPADGIISSICEAELPGEFELQSNGKQIYTRISIFLNIFNVHIQRIPINGNIQKINYRPGAFFNASLDKASEENERYSTLIKTEDGKLVAVVQIAGLIARRIINDLNVFQEVKTGDRFGLIRFGSRVDLYLPAEFEVAAQVGQLTIAGETLVAKMQVHNHQTDLTT